MSAVDFLAFATGGSANVLDQADYEALPVIATGYQSGVAKSEQLNKTWRQGTFVAAAVANFISQQLGISVLDDGNLQAFIDNLEAAINASVSAGAGQISYTAPGAGGVSLTVQQRLNAFLTAAGYGAANDGTDQTADVDAAAAEARTLSIPLLIPRHTAYTGSLAGTERFSTAYSKNDETDYLASFGYLLLQGRGVGIAFFGDSTNWGVDSSLVPFGTQSPTPIPVAMQALLRGYYGNSAAVVENYAISGTDSLQMINGTDGSGLTFEARIAAFGGSIVFCNHGINDVGHGNSAAVYKADLIQFVDIVRKYGKTPVLQTPFPYAGYSAYTNGTAIAVGVQQYAEIMRQVAREMGVPLFDVYKLTNLYLAAGTNYTALIPDGVHPIGAFYEVIGYHAASLLIAPEVLATEDSIVSAGSPRFIKPNGGNGGYVIAPSSLTGVASTVNGGTAGQCVQIPILVEQRGLDLYLAHPFWASGSNNISVSLDGVGIGTLGMYQASLTAEIAVDMETMLVSNIAPGFHVLTLSCPASQVFSFYYVRTRRNRFGVSRFNSPLTGSYNGATQPVPLVNKRLLLWDYQQMVASGVAANEQVVAMWDYPLSCWAEQTHVEFIAQLNKGDGVAFGCYLFSDTATWSSQGARPGFVVGLDETTGFLCVRESGGNATAKTVLGSTDLSAASHTYEVYWSPTGGTNSAGTVQIVLDFATGGDFTYSFQYKWAGGCLGLYRMNVASVTTTLTISKLYLLQP